MSHALDTVRINTKKKTECLKDTTYAIYMKSRGFKDIEYHNRSTFNWSTSQPGQNRTYQPRTGSLSISRTFLAQFGLVGWFSPISSYVRFPSGPYDRRVDFKGFSWTGIISETTSSNPSQEPLETIISFLSISIRLNGFDHKYIFQS